MSIDLSICLSHSHGSGRSSISSWSPPWSQSC